jgi:hypothetical protein
MFSHAQLSQHGFIRSYWGAFHQDGDYAVMQNTFDWKLDYAKGVYSFYANPVFNYNGLNQELNILLRQIYIDFFFEHFDLRIGKQQVIWGKADGVFITDVISPRDLSEFILPEFEEIRIGVDAVKLNYYLGNSTIETVWIPRFQKTISPEENSPWQPTQANATSMQTTFDYSKAEVENSLPNSELALRYSYLGSSLDFDVMATYLWDDNPAMHIYFQPDSVIIQPKYHRLPMFGLSFGKAIGGAVFRSESAYYFHKKFASDFNDNAVTEKDYVHYLIGYDHNWMGVNVSFQFIQEYILDYDNAIFNDRFSNTFTFLVSKSFFRETLTFDLLGYYGIENEDALLRPKIVYDFADGINVILGANIFLGNQGNFGQFDENDMTYLKLKYNF